MERETHANDTEATPKAAQQHMQHQQKAEIFGAKRPQKVAEAECRATSVSQAGQHG